MTRDEIITHLKAELKEELEGILKYNDLYEAADELDMPDVRYTARAIARDEWMHANYLRDILIEHGAMLSPECNLLWEKVEKINE